jgi:hypothetical protein
LDGVPPRRAEESYRLEMLSDRERRYLRGLRWRRRAAIALGLLLALAGGSYGIWGAEQFRLAMGDQVDEARSSVTRDPLANLALLFAPYQQRLRQAEPETEAERILLEELDERTTLSAQLVVLLFRFLFASLVLTTGLILLSTGTGTRRLLAILDSVLEQQPAPDRAE